MDYLDPQKRLRHNVLLMVGYAVVGLGVVLATLFLILNAYGYVRGKNGQIVQNGFVFVSSQPNPAQIYIDNQLAKARTNTRLSLNAGRYTLQLKRSGYRTWQRSVTVLGGDVQHFDYPLLIPGTLSTSAVKSYTAAPNLATQSPDQRWLLVAQPGSDTTFDMYDLKAAALTPTVISLPANIVTKAATSESWQAVEWANDNQRVLLMHAYDGKTEYIVLDRTKPDQSVNLNATFSTTPGSVSLNNKKYDQYYLFDSTQHTLTTAILKPLTLTPYLSHVLAYKSYGSDTVLYATDSGAEAGKVLIKMQVGSKTYPIREVPAGGTYLLDLTGYKGTLYVVAGTSIDGKAYIYKDPAGQLDAQPKQPAAPSRLLRVDGANFVAFSANAQFILLENGTGAETYDIENDRSYTYTLSNAVDSPQPHVTWMDGDRLTYISQGKLVIVDYDNTNRQILMADSAAYRPFFAPDVHHVYGLAPGQSGYDLTQTALLAAADL